MLVYAGKRNDRGECIVTAFKNGQVPQRLTPVIDGAAVSYCGEFDWGSSRQTLGMFQLGLAILAHYLRDGNEDDEPRHAAAQALLMHQPFTALVVSKFREGWRLTEDEIGSAVAQILVMHKERLDRPAAEVEIVMAVRRDVERAREEAEQRDRTLPTTSELRSLLPYYWRNRLL